MRKITGELFTCSYILVLHLRYASSIICHVYQWWGSSVTSMHHSFYDFQWEIFQIQCSSRWIILQCPNFHTEITGIIQLTRIYNAERSRWANWTCNFNQTPVLRFERVTVKFHKKSWLPKKHRLIFPSHRSKSPRAIYPAQADLYHKSWIHPFCFNVIQSQDKYKQSQKEKIVWRSVKRETLQKYMDSDFMWKRRCPGVSREIQQFTIKFILRYFIYVFKSPQYIIHPAGGNISPR